MSNYYTPGVYVEEVSTLPPSVVEGSTAIPAFLGYTQQTAYNGIDRKLIPTRISTMLEFKQLFGGPAPTKVTAVATMDGTVPLFSKISEVDRSPYTLYYTLDLFFKTAEATATSFR